MGNIPFLNMAHGYSALLRIVDKTGEPWPIESITTSRSVVKHEVPNYGVGTIEVRDIDVSRKIDKNIAVMRLLDDSEQGYLSIKLRGVSNPIPLPVQLSKNTGDVLGEAILVIDYEKPVSVDIKEFMNEYSLFFGVILFFLMALMEIKR